MCEGPIPSGVADANLPPTVNEQHEAELERLLRLVPYFAGLDRVSLARLAGALEPVSFKTSELITREGEPAGELYLLEAGSITASVHAESGAVEVGTVTAPGSFGEMGLLL